MNNKTTEPIPTDPAGTRTLDQQRRFISRCDDLNQLLGTTTAKVRQLLRLRGWRMVWSPEEQELFWVKSFPDVGTHYLSDHDAYCSSKNTPANACAWSSSPSNPAAPACHAPPPAPAPKPPVPQLSTLNTQLSTMPKPSIPPLTVEQFRRLVSKHHKLFTDHLLDAHAGSIAQLTADGLAGEVDACNGCEQLMDLDLSRRGEHDYVSEKALVIFWGRKVGCALAAVMLSGHCNGKADLNAPAQAQHPVQKAEDPTNPRPRCTEEILPEQACAAPERTPGVKLSLPPMTARRFCEVFREHAPAMLPMILDTLDWFVEEGELGEWPDASSEAAAGLFSVINSSRRGEHNFTRMEDLCSSWAHNIGMALGAAVLEDHPFNDDNMMPPHDANQPLLGPDAN